MGAFKRPWLVAPIAGIALLAALAFVLLSGGDTNTRLSSRLASAITYDQQLQNIEDSPKVVTLRAPGTAASDVKFDFARPAHGTLGQPTAASCSEGICVVGVLYTPEPDYNGPDRFTYKVSTRDGLHEGSVSIDMAPQNDAPTLVIAGRTEQPVVRPGAQVVPNFATQVSPGPGEDAQKTTIKVEATQPNLFAVQPSLSPDGTLSFTPAADLPPDTTATLNVTVADDGGTGNGGTATTTTQVEVKLPDDKCNFACVLWIAKKNRPIFQSTPTRPGVPIAGAPNVLTNNNPTGGNNASRPGQPTINLPGGGGGQSGPILEGGVIVFNGPNLIQLTAPGPSNQQATLTLTASAGFLTLATVNGLTFSPSPATASGSPAAATVSTSAPLIVFQVGDGNMDATMTFTGTIDEINAALNGMFLVPPTNFAGTITVTITVATAGGTTTRVLTFTITSVNDAPAGADNTVATTEGIPLVFTAAMFGYSDPFDAPPNAFASVIVTTAPPAGVLANNGVPVAAGTAVPIAAINAGQLTFTTAPGQFGAPFAAFTFQVKDDGGTASSGQDTDQSPNTMTINVASKNDAPSFVKGPDQTFNEDAGPQSIAGWATAISPGPPDEAAQLVDFIVTNDNNALFAAQPAIAPNGTLTFAANANANGVANVTVRVHDNGGTAGGGVDTSAPQAFVITINAVNDPPVNTVPVAQTAGEDVGLTFTSGVGNAISIADADAGSASVQTTIAALNGVFTINPAGVTVVGGGTNNLQVTGPVTAINAALQTLLYTGNLNYNGPDTITVTTNDLGNTGGPAQQDVDAIPVTVVSRNDAPSFTIGVPIYTNNEDAGAITLLNWATAISPGPPDEAGQALNFIVTNDNNALFSVQPAIAANGTLTFTTALNANGNTTVTVQLHDNGGTALAGNDTSASQTFAIGLVGANDAPVNTVPGAQVVNEDTNLPLNAGSAISVNDPDADAGGLQVTLTITNGIGTVTATPGVTIGGNGTGVVTLTGVQGSVNTALATLIFRATADYSGAASISVLTSDLGNTGAGGVLTDTDPIAITVNSVNDVPAFVKGPDLTVAEDVGLQTAAGWATALSTGALNEAGQVLDFIVSNDNNALFTAGAGQPALAPNGTLTYTPAPNAFGSAIVTVQIHDNGGVANGGIDISAAQTFNINVAAQNDPPVNTVPAGPLAPNEDSPFAFTGGSSISVADDSGANSITVTLTVTQGTLNVGATPGVAIGTNNTVNVTLTGPLAAINTALGAVTYTSNPNYVGADSLTVLTNDGGFTGGGGALTDSDSDSVVLNVQAVNDVPSFVKGSDQTVNEDAGLQTVAGWATALSRGGGADEAGQALDFIVSNNNTALFTGQPAVASNGTLTYTPAPNANGNATVTVAIHDNGGGTDTSASQTFVITVNAVNDVPSFVKGPDKSTVDTAGAQSFPNWATSLATGGGADETTQTLQFIVSGNTVPGIFDVAPAVAPDGTLTYTPKVGGNGTSVITLAIKDSGGVTNGGVDTSATQTFNVQVFGNNPPTNIALVSSTVPENSAALTTVGAITGTDGDPGDSVASYQFQAAPTAGCAAGTSANNADFDMTGPAATPTLRAVNSFDFEATPAHTRTICLRATDTHGATFDKNLTITVQDVNEAPVVVSQLIAFSTAENTANATPVGAAVAFMDPESGANGSATQTYAYSITGGNTGGAFTINTTTGQISVANSAALDFETTPTFNLTIQVTDAGPPAPPPLSGTAVYVVNLTDVNEAPTAIPHSNTATGNVQISMPRNSSNADNLLNGAVDPDAGQTATLQVSEDPSNAVQGLVFNANGTYTYIPAAGITGPQVAKFRVCDTAGPLCSGPTNLTLTVSNPIWFVNNNGGSCTVNCDGRQTNPFTTLAAFQTANAAGGAGQPQDNSVVFVYESATQYTASVILRSGQRFIGQDANASLSAATGITFAPDSINLPATNTGGNAVQINSAGTTLALNSAAGNNTVRGITFTNANTQPISGTNFGTLTISEVTINNAGTGGGIHLDTGTLAAGATIDSLTATPGGTNNGLSLNNLSGSLAVTTGSITANNSVITNHAIHVAGGSMSLTYGGTATQNGAGAVVNVSAHTTGTLTFNGGIGATNGTGLQFNNADGIYNLTGVVNLNGGNAGVDISNGSAGPISISNASSAITSPSGTAFDIDGSLTAVTSAVTYNGTISQANNAATVSVASHNTGTVTFGGNVSITNGSALQFNNADAAYNFNGTTNTIGTTANAGVNIVNGSAGTFTFSSGTSINNPSGIAYNEDTSTATVTYNGTITKTNNAQNAVNINAKTSGTTDFNGAITATTTTATAIDLTNTGGTVRFDGGLAITTTSGTGFNATGAGASVVATQNNTTIVNTIISTTGTALNVANSTIGANGVTFRSITSTGAAIPINLTGNLSGALTVTGDGTGFANGSGGNVTNATTQLAALTTVSGTFNFRSMNFSMNTSALYGILVDNNAGGTATVNITGSTFIGVASSINQQKALVQFAAGLSANLTGNVQNSYFSSNRTYGVFGDASGSATLNLTVNQSGFGTDINTGAPVNRPGTTIQNAPPFSLGIVNSASSLVDYTISNNTFWGANAAAGAIYAVSVSGASSVAGGHIIGTINNNQIGKAGVLGSGCLGNCAGIGLLPGIGGIYRATVTNNDIRQTGSIGINAVNTVGTATATTGLKIKGNILAEPDTTGAPAFQRAIAVNGSNSGGATTSWCAEIGDNFGGTPSNRNNISGGWQASANIRVTNLGNTLPLVMPGLTPLAGATDANVETFLTNSNTTGTVDATVGTAGINGSGASCY